jgi:hypothetical protein
LPREKRKFKGSGKNTQEWIIFVRLADGTQLYYYTDEHRVDSWGKPLERWGRMSQAYRFPSEEHARHVAAVMQTNSAAKEYAVVSLPPRVRTKLAQVGKRGVESGQSKPSPA